MFAICNNNFLNIENVFIGNPIQKGADSQQGNRKKMGDEFMIANVSNSSRLDQLKIN